MTAIKWRAHDHMIQVVLRRECRFPLGVGVNQWGYTIVWPYRRCPGREAWEEMKEMAASGRLVPRGALR